jgi:hypothetical protein
MPSQLNLALHRTLWEIHIKIFSSDTTGPIATKRLWNDPWMAPFQKHFIPPTKMAATAELNLTLNPMGNSHKTSSCLKPFAQ